MTSEAGELAEVLEAVKRWPRQLRISLARQILETVEVPMTAASSLGLPVKRGKPAEQLIGLGQGSGPPPDDAQVHAWIDEHRLRKYGP